MYSNVASYMNWLYDTMAADVTSVTCPDAPPPPSIAVSALSSVEEDTCWCDHHCSLPHGDWGCCSEECPCQEGEGDCDEDSHCQEDLVCGTNNCPIDGDHQGDCCEAPCGCHKQCQPPHDDWDCCTEECPCREGEGDCDEDSHCQGDLVCGTNNCVLDGDPEADCCEVNTAVTASQSMSPDSYDDTSNFAFDTKCKCGISSRAYRILGGTETEVSKSDYNTTTN